MEGGPSSERCQEVMTRLYVFRRCDAREGIRLPASFEELADRGWNACIIAGDGQVHTLYNGKCTASARAEGSQAHV